MTTERIINSLLDTDLYKLTMGQAIGHNYPEIWASYAFKNRGENMFPDDFADKLREQVEAMGDLRLQIAEKDFLQKSCHYLSSDYIDWLAKFRFNPKQITIRQSGGRLDLKIAGPWRETVYWEVPIMATISELFFRNVKKETEKVWGEKVNTKANIYKQNMIRYSEFGTRRRVSGEVQEGVVIKLKERAGEELMGTSNVDLARRVGLRAVGTFAHEWVMGQAGLFGANRANLMAMEVWNKEYKGQLPVALTDTYSTEVFLRDYGQEMARKFPILRQDSGSPEVWTDQIVKHIRVNLELDPMEFTALYSDSLTPARVLEIENYAKGRIKTMFGIGTNFSNDVGVSPLNIVIKMQEVWQPRVNEERVRVFKLSDTPGKASGDIQQINNLKQVLLL